VKENAMLTIGWLLFVLAARSPQEIVTSPAAAPAPHRSGAPASTREQSQEAAGAYAEFYDVRDLALPARLRSLAPEPGPVAVDRGAVAASELAKLRELGYVADPEESVRANLVAWRLLTALLQCMFSHADPFTCEAKSSGVLVARCAAPRPAWSPSRSAASSSTRSSATCWSNSST
jgi:hypothetical protein